MRGQGYIQGIADPQTWRTLDPEYKPSPSVSAPSLFDIPEGDDPEVSEIVLTAPGEDHCILLGLAAIPMISMRFDNIKGPANAEE